MTKRKNKPRVLITAGPTREYLDPVRYLSNDSSGQMGFALASAAFHLGFKVDLIAGPVALPAPRGVRRTNIRCARQMREAVFKLAGQADIIIMAAAVADWRPAKFSKTKIKKKGRSASISLVQNPDILEELGHNRRAHQVIAGFALETDNLEQNARKKLRDKGCDWIIANSSRAIGAKSGRALLIGRNGRRIALPQLPKKDLALLILSHIIRNTSRTSPRSNR